MVTSKNPASGFLFPFSLITFGVCLYISHLPMKKFYCLLTFSLLSSCLFAQLQSPETFLGYKLGERFTPHYRVIDYFEHVAAQTSNLSLTPYGETNEHRPLLTAFITAPENFDKLEAIRTANLARTGLAEGTSGYDDLAIVWLSYNVHGNEAVSTEAAMEVAYRLADKNNPQTQTWLKNTVVVIDPCINPDGRERYVQWYQQKVAQPSNPDPDAWEHHEPWPGGRMNHYFFDLNRDWAWATQRESQQRLVLYNRWLPHIHVDFHEQGVNSPYYFAPAAEPYHKLITDWQRQFQNTIGKNNARYFDEKGWMYFTRERFDLLYPSYGDTYPVYNGAIGMTFEQGGSGRAGLAVMTTAEDTLTLTDRIAHHVTTSLSTIEVTAQNAGKVVSEFARFFQQAVRNPAGNYKGFVIKQGNNPDKIKALKTLLDMHQIRYGQSKGSRSLSGFNYRNGQTGKFSLEAGDLVLSAYQPKSVLLQVLFEPEATLSDSITYDITAWSVPYAYDLTTYALTDRMDAGGAVQETTFTPAAVAEDAYAYVAPWKSLDDAKYLAQLLKQKVKVRYALHKFSIEGKSFEGGSLIITRANNEDLAAFDQIVVNTANAMQQTLTPVRTGFASEGYDIGSGEVAYIEPPKVLVVAGEGTSPYGVGEIWHFFEQQINYPVTLVNTDDLESINLYDYNTLVLPDGQYKKLLDELPLPGWIRQGGKVIALENALSVFEGKEAYALDKYGSKAAREAAERKEETLQERNRLEPYAGRERRDISGYISGSIFKLRLDNTHPLALGFPDYYYTLKIGSDRYAYLDEGWNVGTIQSREALVSGFAGAEVLEALPESLVFGVENKGRGELVYMVDNPLFRAFWYNGKLLFANALFLVGQE